jgi:hypothetical protein
MDHEQEAIMRIIQNHKKHIEDHSDAIKFLLSQRNTAIPVDQDAKLQEKLDKEKNEFLELMKKA